MVEEYPVLVGKIAVCLDQWHEVGIELAERLASDQEPIQKHFFLAGRQATCYGSRGMWATSIAMAARC